MMVTRKDGKMARPTKMTPETIDKLRQAFLIGATKEEAARYAGISKVTLYNYIEKVPEFVNDIQGWQDEPILKAKTMVVRNLDKDIKNAQWYLERKKKDEFSPRTELGGTESNPIRMMIEKFGLDKEDDDDRKDDGDVQVPSPEQS